MQAVFEARTFKRDVLVLREGMGSCVKAWVADLVRTIEMVQVDYTPACNPTSYRGWPPRRLHGGRTLSCPDQF
jgi:hypothetical protein